MKKEVDSLRLEVNLGKVWLYQEMPPMEEQVITITKDQIVLMIEWLRQAKEALDKNTTDHN
jgi:hypothetical protein